MELIAFQSVVIALVLGVTSYILSRWLRIPAILFYLFFGLAFGPVGLGAIDPGSLGEGLHILLEIMVAIILFEGGLSLSSHSFRSESSAIQRILIVALPLTGLGGSLLAGQLLGLSWRLSIFFGALIVVTGPTVIGSILKSVYLPRRLEILLNWESIWGDVIGVLLSAVSLEILDMSFQGSFIDIGVNFILRIFGGIAIGVLSGYLLGWILVWIARLKDFRLLGIVSLTFSIAVFFVANVTLHSSGPMAVAVAGFYLSNTRKSFLHEIRHFKDQISSLFISFMFVLLSAYVNPLPLLRQWPMMLLTALILGLAVRPLSVLIALFGSSTTLAERLYIGIIAPRGILAVATVAYASLTVGGYESEMAVALNLTFAIIFFSGLTATVLCRPLARFLGVLVPASRSGLLLVGINALSLEIAKFASKHAPVSFLETKRDACRTALLQGVESVCADLLDSGLYEDALEEGFGRLLAITRNDALNRLIALKASIHLKSQNIYRVMARPEKETIRLELDDDCHVAFSREFYSIRAIEMIEREEARLETLNGERIEEYKKTGDKKVIPLLEALGEKRGVAIVLPDKPVENEALCFVLKNIKEPIQ